jgi:hypothetical protein
MPTYLVTNKQTGAEVSRYSSKATALLEDYPLSDFAHTEYVEPDPQVPPPSPRRLSKLQFIERLGDAAYLTILGMAKVSVEVEGWVKKLEYATPEPDGTSIDLSNPVTIAGVEAIGTILEAQGVVAAGWAQGVLHGN